jgi:polyadenylate-binding protein 2
MEEEAQMLRQFTEEANAQSSVLPDPVRPKSTPTTSMPKTSEINEDETMEEDPSIVDSRSIYVGNACLSQDRLHGGTHIIFPKVDYASTPEEIQAHFQSCGSINRVTILCDKFTGHPKGWVVGPSSQKKPSYLLLSFAYVEFSDPLFVQHAMVLNDSMFRGRLIKVRSLVRHLV